MSDSLRVLVVDDDPTTLLVTKARLEAAGFVVQTRAQAIGTSAEIAEWKPDLILLDVNMPGLSGPALAELVRGRGANQPSVVFHSGEESAHLARLTKSCGALGFIAKSNDGVGFVESFRKLVQKHRERRADG